MWPSGNCGPHYKTATWIPRVILNKNCWTMGLTAAFLRFHHIKASVSVLLVTRLIALWVD
jgi:hypothetical protein